MPRVTVGQFIAMLEALDRSTVVRFSVNGAYVDEPEISRGSGVVSLSFGAFARAQPSRERALANAYDLIGRLRRADESVEAALSESNAERLLTWWEPRIAAAQIARDDLLAAVPVERSGGSRDEGEEPAPHTNFPRTRNSLASFCVELQEVAMLVSRMQPNGGRRRIAVRGSEFIATLRRLDRDVATTFAMRGMNLGAPTVTQEVYGVSIALRDRAEPRSTRPAAVANARDFIVTVRKANGAFLARAEQFAGVREYERIRPAIDRLCEDQWTWWDERIADARRVLADLLAFLPLEVPKRLAVLDDRRMARTRSFSELCIELERLIILVERAI